MVEPDDKDEALAAGDESPREETPEWRRNWVTVDPTKARFGKAHACVVLRQVNDALHGHTEAEAVLQPYADYEP